MFIDRLALYDRLVERTASDLKLTLDLGHVPCTEELSIPAAIERYGERLANVHIEDIRGRRHVHLPFGEGDVDFPPVLTALTKVGYRGLVNVELSRSSHMAPKAAAASIAFLRSVSS